MINIAILIFCHFILLWASHVVIKRKFIFFTFI